MTKVHRYRAVQIISMGGVNIGYDPHGPDVVMAVAYDEQRAQLTERGALLREVLELIDDGVGRSDAEWQLIQKLRAAMSASAEKSAPVEPYPNRLCHVDYTAHPYQCGCLKGDEESQRIYDEHFSGATAEPSAPVELSVSQLERER